MNKRIRVLHIDDEPDTTEMTAAQLERRDERLVVETANDADTALSMISEDGFDCIISDQEMSSMSGIDILEAVREDYPDMPFILFTGRGSEEVASEAISAGVTDYLQKSGGAEQYTVLANRVVNAVETARAKSEARWSQERLQNLSEAFPDIAFYIDEDGRYVEFIAGDRSPLLYDEAETLVGQRFHEILPSETADRFYEVVQEALETEELQKIEYMLDVQAGEKWFEARIVPLETTLSDRRMVIWVARDITERKQHEQELERQNRRLDEFASVVSHDLRNPLTIAKGRLALAREDCDSEHLNAVAQAHDRMETLISSLLKLSKKGGEIEGVEPVDLGSITQDCWRNVDTAGCNLVIDESRTVKCESSQLQQLLENLIRNSVEHGSTSSKPRANDSVEHGSADGQKEPDEAVEHDDEEAETVTVTVGVLDDEGTEGFYLADDGVGIPEEERDEVFESGYSTSEDGAGFGLSIVKEIVEAHGWDIDVTESEDGGTRFEVTGVGFAE